MEETNIIMTVIGVQQVTLKSELLCALWYAPLNCVALVTYSTFSFIAPKISLHLQLPQMSVAPAAVAIFRRLPCLIGYLRCMSGHLLSEQQ
jgi:hypothetical protein